MINRKQFMRSLFGIVGIGLLPKRMDNKFVSVTVHRETESIVILNEATPVLWVQSKSTPIEDIKRGIEQIKNHKPNYSVIVHPEIYKKYHKQLLQMYGIK
jgi:hypothetical protein